MVSAKRAHVPAARGDRPRVLAWPRCVTKHSGRMGLWRRTSLPNPALRRGPVHASERPAAFSAGYRRGAHAVIAKEVVPDG